MSSSKSCCTGRGKHQPMQQVQLKSKSFLEKYEGDKDKIRLSQERVDSFNQDQNTEEHVEKYMLGRVHSFDEHETLQPPHVEKKVSEKFSTVLNELTDVASTAASFSPASFSRSISRGKSLVFEDDISTMRYVRENI